MKYLYFLLFVAASQAFVTRKTRDVQDIPEPHLTGITLIDDPSLAFKVDWTRDPHWLKGNEDRILGYKLKVWEQPKIKTYKYETVNGVRMLVEEYAPAKFSNTNDVPTHKSKEIHVLGEETTTAKVDDIQSGVTYEVRVQAYTRKGDGPLSAPMRIEVSTNDNDRQRDVYNVE